MKCFNLLAALGCLIFVSACASGPCRKPQQVRGVDDEPTASAPTTAPVTPSQSDRVFIYKYDGSLQCKMGKPVAVAEMKKELKGIQVYSMENRNDGQMHIQVCGSITGQANVYEISQKDLKEAEKRGFRRWAFK